MSSASVWFSTLSPKERQELTSFQDSPLIARPDLLVIGGGIVGLATAYFAVDQGVKVQVIDAGDIAAQASGANAGGISPNTDGSDYPEAYASLAFASRDLWARLTVRPGFDFDWRVSGLLVVDPAHFAPSAQEFTAAQLERGFAPQPVDAEQIRLLEPALRDGLQEGIHYPAEAQLHPVRAALSFARAIRAKGGAVRSHVRAERFDQAHNRVTGVQTTSGKIEAGQTIVATGWDTALLTSLSGTKLPVHPGSGQMVFTDPLPPLLRGPIAGKYRIAQLKSGEIVTGGGLIEHVQAEPDSTLTNDIITHARELIPALADVPFPGSWSGVRPMSPDGLPVVDRFGDFENLFVACGHSRKGVLLAPLSGKLLADWIVSGMQPEELAPLSLRRFAEAT